MRIDNSFDIQLPTVKNPDKQQKNEIEFSQFLNKSIQSVSDLQDVAEQKNLKFITGEINNVHEVMIASQKADVALQSFIEVKNKVIEAYKEIMRIQI